MSKIALKKELNKLSQEQLVELILDAYNASKETKEYFEFFLNPDIEALYEKKIDLIARELSKTKHGRCKARISYIRNTIKEFRLYGASYDYVLPLMSNTIAMLVGQERWYYFTEALTNGIYKLTTEYIETANQAGMITTATEVIDKIVKNQNVGRERIRQNVGEIAAKAIAQLSSGALVKKKK